jgi:MFS family permease
VDFLLLVFAFFFRLLFYFFVCFFDNDWARSGHRSSIIFAASFIGVAAIFGRFCMGLMSDRIGKKRFLMICICLQTLTWAWMIYVSDAWMINVFAPTFGFSYGGISFKLSAIVGDLLGRAQSGTITGVIFGVGGMCTALGPLITGEVFDRTGSYLPTFLFAVGRM